MPYHPILPRTKNETTRTRNPNYHSHPPRPRPNPRPVHRRSLRRKIHRLHPHRPLRRHLRPSRRPRLESLPLTLRQKCPPYASHQRRFRSPRPPNGPDDYINLAGGYFKSHAFYEQAIVNKVDRFGNIVQVFSSYESRNAPNEKPFARGINSIQLFYDQNRWYVLSILWDEESPTNPLPANLATRTTAPVTQ